MVIPLLGVVSLSVALIEPKFEDKAAAISVARRLNEIRSLRSIALLLDREHVNLQFLLLGESHGLNSYSTSSLLGFDIKGSVSETQASIASYPELANAEASAKVAQLSNDRSRWARNELSTEDYVSLVSQTETSLLRRAQMLGRTRAERIRGDLRQSIEYSDALIEVDQAQKLLIHRLFDLVAHHDKPWVEKSGVDLGAAAALLESALRAAAEDAPPPERPGLAQLAAEFSVEDTLEEARHFTETAGEEHNQLEILRLFSMTQTRPSPDRIDAALASALTQATSLASKVRQDANEKFRTYLLFSVAIFLTTGGLSVAISLTLSHHLGRLAARSKRIADGDLARDCADVRAPREITTIHHTLDSLADNLRKVQNQSAALAAGDLDSCLTEDRATGPLGDAVQASVEALATSFRDRAKLQTRLSHQATHDSLTGLANRAAALTFLDQSLNATRDQIDGETADVCAFFIDIDNFKKANDLGGHVVGDEVLIAVADRLRSGVGGTGMVARLGGDEFLVIVPGPVGVIAANDIASRLIDAIAQPLVCSGIQMQLGASIGFTLARFPMVSSDVLSQADLALHAAKAKGRYTVVAFEASIGAERDRRTALERNFERALANDLLELHYQPILDCAGAVLSVESLLRWTHNGVPQSPALCIPIIETTPTIVELGRWVLRRATAETVAIHRYLGGATFSVSVNLSLRHIVHANVVDDIRAALEGSQLAPELLTIEVTETAIVNDLDVAIDHLRKIRALGVKVAIDDFGTGYTSIGQLSRFPCDILKIDREFVDQLHVPSSHHIVELIIDVGHNLGHVVVAEGVETTEQLDELWALGCDRVQGYLLGRPMTKIKLCEIIADTQTLRV